MRNLQVLVVEDEALVSRVMREGLNNIGLEVVTAPTGQQACNLLREPVFDVLVVDLRLPDMDGWHVLKAARQSNPGVRSIVITAYETGDVMSAFPVAEIDSILYKPFDLKVLLSTVRSLLREMLPPPAQSEVTFFDQRIGSPHNPALNAADEYRAHSFVTVRPLNESWQPTSCQYIGQIARLSDRRLKILTPPASGSPQQLEIEYVGEEGLYGFRAEVIQVTHKQTESVWLLQYPARVEHTQRRRFPRQPARGQVTLAPLGERMLRTLIGELINISESGMRVRTSRGLNQSVSLHALVEWQAKESPLTFETWARVVYGIGRVQRGHVIHDLGLELVQAPAEFLQHIRERDS